MSQNKKSSVCKHFVKGFCKYDKDCKFIHSKGKPKNTTDFTPLQKSVDLRIVVDTHQEQLQTKMSKLDILLAPNIFNQFEKLEMYHKLDQEIKNCGIDSDKLLKLWHGDNKNIKGTHFIADDKTNWKDQ